MYIIFSISKITRGRCLLLRLRLMRLLRDAIFNDSIYAVILYCLSICVCARCSVLIFHLSDSDSKMRDQWSCSVRVRVRAMAVESEKYIFIIFIWIWFIFKWLPFISFIAGESCEFSLSPLINSAGLEWNGMEGMLQHNFSVYCSWFDLTVCWLIEW